MDEYGSSAGIARNASESEYPGLWRGLVGLWCPSAGLTGNRLLDYGGRNNFTGSSLPWSSGRVGASVSLNGSSSFASGNDLGFPTGSGARSFSVWFTCAAVSAGQTRFLFTYGTATGTNYWTVGVSDAAGSKALYVATLSAGVRGNTLTNIDDGKWHHAVWVYNGTTEIFYFDGLPAGSGAHTVATTLSGTTYIGRVIGGFYWSGKLDDLRLYNRVLTANEVRQMYFGASPLVPLNRPYFNSPSAPPPAANTTNFFRFFR
jgi:hypothetical protein